MCASYGLDPRFSGYEALAEADQELVAELRAWAQQNASETIRPTGKNLRNVNALIRGSEHGPRFEQAWWGYLVGGEPAKFPSINTRLERLQERPGGLAGRAIVPATNWLEMQKPSRDWYSFGLGERELFGMAAVTQQGRPTGGDAVTCYSIVMQPAPEALTDFHDRMPLLIPADFADVWLDPAQDPTRELIDAALDAGRAVTERVAAVRLAK
ncbi:MAG TPA: SOS response-associated peptidase family protein [Microbacteriaceae bacterium]